MNAWATCGQSSIHLLNAQPACYITTKRECFSNSRDYLLVIQCPNSWIYSGETVQRSPTCYVTPRQLDILRWNSPTITYLLYNAQPAGYIAVKQTSDYLLVTQWPSHLDILGWNRQQLSTCYTMSSHPDILGQNRPTTIYLLYNPQPRWNSPTTLYTVVIQCPANWIYWGETDQWFVIQYSANWTYRGETDHYLLVIQCPTYWLHQGETVQGLSTCFTMPNLLVTSGWNSPRII